MFCLFFFFVLMFPSSLTCGEIELMDQVERPLVATGEHPFLVQGKGWVCAKDLSARDLVRTSSGIYRRIVSSLPKYSKMKCVYNMTVDAMNCYYVKSETQQQTVLTHNIEICIRDLEHTLGTVGSVGEKKWSNNAGYEPSEMGNTAFLLVNDVSNGDFLAVPSFFTLTTEGMFSPASIVTSAAAHRSIAMYLQSLQHGNGNETLEEAITIHGKKIPVFPNMTGSTAIILSRGLNILVTTSSSVNGTNVMGIPTSRIGRRAQIPEEFIQNSKDSLIVVRNGMNIDDNQPHITPFIDISESIFNSRLISDGFDYSRRSKYQSFSSGARERYNNWFLKGRAVFPPVRK